MKIVFAALLMFLITGSAVAVVDPDPNSLGVYFDLNADVNYLDVAPNTVFSAYIMLTNPTWDNILAFEFGYELVVPAGMEGMIFRLATILPPTVNPNIFPGFLRGEYIYGISFPYPINEATVLVEWQILIVAPMTIEFFLGPSSIPGLPGGLPVIMNADEVLMSVGVSSGDVNLSVAEINTGYQPVTVESATWGDVKSLFR